MRLKFPTLIVCLILLTNCGFKLTDLQNNYYITEINTIGDKRINYKLKTKLLSSSKKESKNILLLNVNTKKEKIIKERNIKNEITKYQLNIIADVNLYLIAEDKSLQFKVSESGEFSVKSIHSKTIFNEKKTLKILSENISDKIIEEITIKLNDL